MSGMEVNDLKKELEKFFDFLVEKKLLPAQAKENKKEIVDMMANVMKTTNPSLDKTELAKPEMQKTILTTMLAVAKNPQLALLHREENQKNNEEIKQLTRNLLKPLCEALNKLSPKPLNENQLESKIDHFVEVLSKKLDEEAPDEDPEKQQTFAMAMVASVATMTRDRMYGTKQGVDNLENVELEQFTAQATAVSTDSFISTLTTYDTRDGNQTTASNTEANILDDLSGAFEALEESLGDLGKTEHELPRPKPPGIK